MPRFKRTRHRRTPKHRAKKKHSVFLLLDQFSAKDIEIWETFIDSYLKYYWDYYKELAYQRSKISDQIKKSLLEASRKSFQIKKWQRAVKYKYALKPFSMTGSLMDPGGRFNIGDINPDHYPPFPALYLTENKKTAIQELLNQKTPSMDPSSGLTPMDAALMKPDSVTFVSVSGSLGPIINLKKPETLRAFVDLIKNFSISADLKKRAKSIDETAPEIIKTVPKLIHALQDSNWRLWPMQFDIPSVPQIFGQLASSAGIEGILYTSQFSGQDCLAVFPQNFDDESFIQLNDDSPDETSMTRLDSGNWKKTLEE